MSKENKEVYEVIRKAYNANTYNTKYRDNRKLTDTEEGLLSDMIREMPGTRLLDVGCGNGELYDRYFVDKGCDVTGIDISEYQIDCAWKNIPTENFIEGNFVDMKLSEIPCVDGVICMYALFHFMGEDQKIAIQRMYNVLQYKGICLLKVRTEFVPGIKYSGSWCNYPMYWSLPGILQILYWCTEVGFSCKVYEDPDNADYAFLWLEK